MVNDVRLENYKTPISSLSKEQKEIGGKQPGKKDEEVKDVLWWVGFVISCSMTFLYSIGIYFTYFDDPADWAKTFKNESIPGLKKK